MWRSVLCILSVLSCVLAADNSWTCSRGDDSSETDIQELRQSMTDIMTKLTSLEDLPQRLTTLEKFAVCPDKWYGPVDGRCFQSRVGSSESVTHDNANVSCTKLHSDAILARLDTQAKLDLIREKAGCIAAYDYFVDAKLLGSTLVWTATDEPVNPDLMVGSSNKGDCAKLVACSKIDQPVDCSDDIFTFCEIIAPKFFFP